MFLLQEGIMKAWNFLLSLLENSINFIAHYNRLFFIKTITTKSSIPHALLQCDPDIPPWREGVWFPSLWIWVVVNDSFLTKKKSTISNTTCLHVFWREVRQMTKFPPWLLEYSLSGLFLSQLPCFERPKAQEKSRRVQVCSYTYAHTLSHPIADARNVSAVTSDDFSSQPCQSAIGVFPVESLDNIQEGELSPLWSIQIPSHRICEHDKMVVALCYWV